jgi:hypothetical protein
MSIQNITYIPHPYLWGPTDRYTPFYSLFRDKLSLPRELVLLYCFPFLSSFTDSVTTVRWVTNMIAVIATIIVNNAITVVTITIVTITRLANIIGIIANVISSFIISVLIKNIVIAITAVSFIMVRYIKSNIVVTSSLRLLPCFSLLFSSSCHFEISLLLQEMLQRQITTSMQIPVT